MTEDRPRQGADPRVMIQYLARNWYKANDVVFTGDNRIRKTINLMLQREGEQAYRGPIGWQGYFLFVLLGNKFIRIDMQSEPFDKAFTDLGYKESA